MLASITPLGERARGSRWGLTAGFFLAGSTLAGAAAGAVTGELGHLVLQSGAASDGPTTSRGCTGRSTRGGHESGRGRSPRRRSWRSRWSWDWGPERSMVVSAHGISVDLPHGWEGRIFRRRHGDPTLHAATFALP